MSSVDRSLVHCTANPAVHSLHSSEMKRTGLDVLEKVRLVSSGAEIGNNVVERSHPCRPPIKIVLKPVKKCEMNPLFRAKCEVQDSSPINRSDGATRTPVHSLPDLHSSTEKSVFKIRSSVPQRRSDTACPPMIKATSTEIITVSFIMSKTVTL